MADDRLPPGVRWRQGGKRLVELLSGGKKTDEKDVEQLESAGRISVSRLAELATVCWRVRKRVAKTADNNEESRRILRDLDGTFEIFRSMGIEIKDYTGETFDYGLPLKVITTQPVPGLLKEKVSETIKPTVLWKDNLIQMGEVIIETPMEAQ